jgi:ABC-2 type transport system ATP-binding protein
MFHDHAPDPVAPDPVMAIEIRGLRKTYAASGNAPSKEALKGIDLMVPRGSFFALLGPNGAGKSTCINILAGLVNKTAGAARIWGFDIDRNPRNARAAIGVVPQEISFDAFFSPREVLELQAGLYGVPRAERRTDDILAAMHLTEQADAYARSLSGGMKRRLLVAKAMVHNPPILVLDEPTAGVDIELRQQLWDYVRTLNAAGVTIVLTTHYLEEAEQLCDRIAIINHGEVVACDTTPDLLARIDEKELLVTVGDDLAAPPAMPEGVRASLCGVRRLRLQYSPATTRVDSILAALRDQKVSIVDLSTKEADLEDIFLQLTRTQ